MTYFAAQVYGLNGTLRQNHYLQWLQLLTGDHRWQNKKQTQLILPQEGHHFVHCEHELHHLKVVSITLNQSTYVGKKKKAHRLARLIKVLPACCSKPLSENPLGEENQSNNELRKTAHCEMCDRAYCALRVIYSQ